MNLRNTRGRGHSFSLVPEWIAMIIVAGFGLLAYGNSLGGAFVFDDLRAVVANPTIRHVWPPDSLWHFPAATTVTGRPLLNFSFAVNYAFGGYGLTGYHLANIIIHLLGGLTLFGVVRRTFMRMPSFVTTHAPWIVALSSSLLWTVHPVQTEAVDYISQRGESLMGLCYLFTLYSFIRAAELPGSRRGSIWLGLSVATCLCGMAVKEVMVTAPVMILLYDRTFVSGRWQEALRTRRWYYIGLATSWLFLTGLLALSGGNRNGSIGFGIGVSSWRYALTQLVAIPHYLRLCFWPHPLIFEYGPFSVSRLSDLFGGACVIAVLLGGTILATWRRSPLGFLGCWFFGILAPTSSVVPGATQMVVEHRVYLSLAAIAVLAGTALYVAFAPAATTKAWAPEWGRFFALLLVLVCGLTYLTIARNRDYRGEIILWQDTVAKRPSNPVAHHNLGALLLQAGRLPEAAHELERALQLRPDDAEARNDLGTLYVREQRPAEAVASFRAATLLKPRYADAHFNLAAALSSIGNLAEAAAEYAVTVQLLPTDAEAHYGFGTVLARRGDLPQAVQEFSSALALRDDFVDARFNLAVALVQLGRSREAIRELRRLVASHPSEHQALELLGELETGDAS